MLYEFLDRIVSTSRALSPRFSSPDPTLIEQCAALLEDQGEGAELTLARDILAAYRPLPDTGKIEFFAAAIAEFGIDEDLLRNAYSHWRRDRSADHLRRIHNLSEPNFIELLRRLNRTPGGTLALVEMREDLLRLMRDNPDIAPLDFDFLHLFRSWFNRGFLRIERVDWSTPAALLEKIIQYEAVHEISGWNYLRRRVAAKDRRLYAFFHPALRNEPLIFIEVALMMETPNAITAILDRNRVEVEPADATTAVFYSISNCHAGLAGVSFGSFLIKQVVTDLSRDLPQLRAFATLSPAPGLKEWVTGQNLSAQTPEEQKQAAMAYLLEAKTPRGRPLDPVERFHIGNGARLDRINTGADPSERGQDQSYGVMVNYLYDLASIDANRERFAETGEIATS